MKRSIIGILLGLVLSAIGVLIVSRSIDEPPRLVSLWPIAVGVVVMVVCWLIQGAVMSIIARPQLGDYRVLGMSKIYLASQAVAALTPFGGAELPYQIFLLRRLGLPVAMGTATITIKSMANGTVLVAGTILGILTISGLPVVESKILIAAVAAIIVGWVLLEYVMHRRTTTSAPAAEGRGGSKINWRARASGFLKDLGEGLSQLRSQEPWAIAGCVGLMLLYWMLYPLLGVLGLMAAGWSGEGWQQVYVAQFVLYLAIVPLAPTPGGSGAAEVGFAALVGPDVPPEVLLGGVIIWRALNHYSELVLGSFFVGRGVNNEVPSTKK